MALIWKTVSTYEGLKLIGQESVKRGSVITRHGRGLKRYSFRHRVGDGHRLVRWGRLCGATVCLENARVLSVIFDVCPRNDLPADNGQFGVGA